MSIQINNINVIDDDRNFSAAGIVTVGTGNSATIIDGTTGITSVGIGVTIDGIAGNISIAGTITAAGFNIPANIASFSPAIGATNVAITTSIVLTFSQVVGTGTTGYLYVREGSAGGTTIGTFGVDDVTLTNRNTTLDIPLTSEYSTDIYTVMEEGFINSTDGDFVGLNTTGADSYSFTTKDLELGDAYEGGYLICQASSVQWILSPEEAEVQRNWTSRTDSNTRAQEVSGCTGWFIPNCNQALNPGYACRQYWDSYSVTYWTDTGCAPPNQYNQDQAWYVNMTTGTLGCTLTYCQYNQIGCLQIRSYRCVSY